MTRRHLLSAVFLLPVASSTGKALSISRWQRFAASLNVWACARQDAGLHRIEAHEPMLWEAVKKNWNPFKDQIQQFYGRK